MTPNLLIRLARLEGQAAPSPTLANAFTPGIRLLWLLLAVHAGGLQPREAVAEGTARALGYGGGREMRDAMRSDGTAIIEWNSRHNGAVTLLLHGRNGGPSAGMDRNEAAIRSLWSEIPEKLQSSFGIADQDEAIRLATEWVSL